jgi:hypothetical protein
MMLVLLAAIVGIVFVVLGLAHTITLSTGVAVGLIALLSVEILRVVESRYVARTPAP